jgi:hypothetical protein
MGVAANAGGLQAGLLQRGKDVRAIHAAHRFDAFEAGSFHDAIFFEDAALHADSRMHDRFAEFAIGRRCDGKGRGAGGGEF